MLVFIMKRTHEDESVSDVQTYTHPTTTTTQIPQSSDVLDSSIDRNQLNIQTITTMFLRVTYWLNGALTKSINAGLRSVTHPNVYEPYVMLASVNSDGKVFGISQKQWGLLTTRMNEVTLCLINKQKKTVFIDFELALAVKKMFGKQFVTLFAFVDEGKTSPFLLSEQEWKLMVNHAVNISGYLKFLTVGKETMNRFIYDKLTHTLADETEDNTQYNRLEEELKVFMTCK